MPWLCFVPVVGPARRVPNPVSRSCFPTDLRPASAILRGLACRFLQGGVNACAGANGHFWVCRFPGKFCRFCREFCWKDGQTAVRKTCEQICEICPQVLPLFASRVLPLFSRVLPSFSNVSDLLTISHALTCATTLCVCDPTKIRGRHSDGQ